MNQNFNKFIMKTVPKAISRGVGRSALVLKKQSPNILFGAGIAGVVTSGVLACRATLKLSETLDDIDNDVKQVKGIKIDVANGEAEAYPVEQVNKDLAYVYAKAGISVVKLYGPSLVIGVVSIGALTGSHVQLTRRNTAIMAAYATLDKAYNEYRERVRKAIGEEHEAGLYLGVEGFEIDKVNGKDKLVPTVTPGHWSAYARFFDEGSGMWKKDSELNRLFLQHQQNYANNLLSMRGHLFLNEVYDALDIERSTEGSVVGWIFNGEGDNYVDFGIFDAYNSGFIQGHEPRILLDFNVDGIIYDKI
jgi:Family of unknown function (DUF6353)